jgi:hypothetical protein
MIRLTLNHEECEERRSSQCLVLQHLDQPQLVAVTGKSPSHGAAIQRMNGLVGGGDEVWMRSVVLRLLPSLIHKRGEGYPQRQLRR